MLKKPFEKVRRKLFTSLTNNKDFEFEADLEDHPLGIQNVYRLHYVDYHRIKEGYGMGPDNVGCIDWPFRPFMLPLGMNREDAFKVLSFLTDYIEQQFQIAPCSYKSVEALDSIIDLERLGFGRLNISGVKNDADIVDLFTVTGRLLLFKQSENYFKYFDWYTKNVTIEEVKNIYDRIGVDFSALFSKESPEEMPEIQEYARLVIKDPQRQ